MEVGTIYKKAKDTICPDILATYEKAADTIVALPYVAREPYIQLVRTLLRQRIEESIGKAEEFLRDVLEGL